MLLASINFWAVLVAAISAFIVGGIWYSPKVFGNIWMKAVGMENVQCKKGHTIAIFVSAFILSLIAATILAITLGPQPPFKLAFGASLAVGIGWVATSFGINYLFANRGFTLFLIDAGYHVVQFAVYGIIFGLWH
jgi:hypothetical protein